MPRDQKLILTPDRRLRVFISSTIAELAEERAAARSAVEEIRMHPVLFELGARPYPPRDLYRAYLAQSDIFIGIYWQSYGWIAPEMDISGLEDEFLLSEGMPRLIYVKEPAPDREPRLDTLLHDRIANTGVSYRKFTTPDELGKLIRDDLAILLTERFERVEHGTPEPEERPTTKLRTKLPLTTNRLIGRTKEIADVSALLMSDDVRLVTLIGPGGVGKSRLAIDLGSALKDRFPDGVHFVMLEMVSDPGEVPSALAASLDLTELIGSANPSDLVMRFLSQREMLLILDNFEHVVEAGPFVSELLANCPGLRILVTSRTILRLRGEHDYLLLPLAVPEEGDEPVSEAVELFLARADRSPMIESFEQREAVAEICRRLEGLPLAIELAAARTSILPPSEILKRLDDRLELLRGQLRDFPERQQTMRTAIAWSVDLLPEEDQLFFRRASVFTGGFSLDAVEKVCDPTGELDALERVQNLIDSSLVIASPGGSEPRMRMLESIRQFAAEQLEASGERRTFAERHAEHFLELIEWAGPELRSERQVATLDRLESEDRNLRTALRWLLDAGRAEEVSQAGWRIWPFWWIRGRLAEGKTIMSAAAADPNLSPLGRARAQAGQGTMCLFIGEHGEAVYLLVTASEQLRALGDKEGLGLVQAALGIVSSVAEGPEEAMARLSEAEALLREVGDDYALVLALNSLCWMLMLLEVELENDDIFRESVALSGRVGSAVDQGMAIGNYGRRLANTDRVEGLKLLKRSIELMIESDMRSGASFMTESVAELASLDGEEERALNLYGFADALREAVGALPIPALEIRRIGYIERLTERLGSERVEAEMDIGRAYSFERGMGEAFEVIDVLLQRAGAGPVGDASDSLVT